MKNSNDLFNKFGSNLSHNVKLANYSWFNLGGNAEYFFKPEDTTQLLNFLKEVKKKNINTTYLGAGSNTLFRDKGFKGAVIKLGKNFSYTKLLENKIIEVGAGTLDRKVADFAKENNLTNFEFLSCIPGSIGGAIIMNSGCYDYDISKILVSIKAISKVTCQEIEIKKEDIEFEYRGTNLSSDLIIISAKLKGSFEKKELIEKKQLNLIERKKKSQPSKIKTCGSTFKNISKNKKAWMLIKDAGCDKFEEGEAAISEKHCNFFINKGKARSLDIENLIQKVKKKVYEKTKVNLELEIKIVGE
tara:strand:- start:3027 stop:3932 length:906 start_codon:yes stop_codon:yes gene_type:complete